MYKVLNLKESEEWILYLNKLPIEQQDIYYTPEYYALYENNGDGKACCFIFEKDGDLALYPFLINSINKLGYDLDAEYYDIQGAYGYNGVISSSYDKLFIEEFYSNFESFCQEKNIVAEFIRFHPLIFNYLFSENNINITFDRKTVYVDLTKSEEEIFSSFQRSTRKQIRNGVNKYGLKVLTLSNNTSYTDTFTDIYWEAMKRVNSVKYLYFNKRYFKELFDNSFTYQFIALYEEKPVAIISAMNYGNFMQGHLGGALTNSLHLSSYSLLYWEMIKKAKMSGNTFLHVGGGATSKENDSLLKFKQNFSKQLADFYIGKKIHSDIIYSEVRKQWKKRYPDSFEKNKNMLLGYREI